MTHRTFDRRLFLRGALGTAALTAGPALLSGCGDGGKSNTNAVNAKVKLPSYTAYQGPQPDLRGTSEGVLDGFLKYPANPKRVTKGPPGDGSTVNVFVETYSPIPPGLSQNQYWQQINKRVGLNLKMTVITASDYADKLATTTAGGDLPDLLQLAGLVPQLPQMLAAKYEDLTPYLGGDAVKDYPFLANIPEVYWKTACVYNGGIYGVPIPRSKMGAVFYLRSDILSAKGLDPAPASFADFKKLCMALTEPRQNKWAIANPTGAVNFVQQMLGVANSWKNDGGKLTNSLELEETKQAIAAVAQLAKAGTVHPDSYDPTLTTDFKQWFNAGNAALDYDNYTAWPQFYVQNVAGPSFKIAGMLPPAYDSGSKPVTWQGNPDLSFTAIKKGDKKRIKMLLEVCNWLSAPFGTEEYLFRTYGIAGRDYEVKNGDPVVTSTGEAEVPGLSIGYIANAPTVLYFPGFPEATKDGYEFQRKFLPMAVANPTLGLYSNTNSTKGSDLNLKITDAQTAILQGREPLSSWDDAVKTWRSSGGDTIRKEYQDALQSSS